MLKIISSKLFIIILLMFPGFVQAVSLRMDATLNSVDIENSIAVGQGYRTLSVGSPVSLGMTRTVNSWQPGSVVVPGAFRNGFSVSLLGHGKEIKLPVIVEGLAYGGVTEFSVGDPPLMDSPGTAGHENLLDIGSLTYGVLGQDGEFARKVLTVGKGEPPRTPFTQVKPIISFDEKEIIETLKAIRPVPIVPIENYRGLMNFPYSYKVQYIAGGPWVTEIRNFSFSIELNYVRRNVSSFTVENGATQIMTIENGGLTYGGGERSTVTGKTKFIIKAEGYFPEGIDLNLIPSGLIGSSAAFTLKNDQGIEQIPYDVTCSSHSGPMSESQIKCNGSTSSTVVKRGEATRGNAGVAEVVITLENKEAQVIYFTLGVDFVSEYTKTGTYSDVFIVQASPVII